MDLKRLPSSLHNPRKACYFLEGFPAHWNESRGCVMNLDYCDKEVHVDNQDFY